MYKWIYSILFLSMVFMWTLTTVSTTNFTEYEKVVISMLIVPDGAVPDSMVKEILTYCKNNNIRIAKKKHLLYFFGPREHLKRISDYIFMRIDKL